MTWRMLGPRTLSGSALFREFVGLCIQTGSPDYAIVRHTPSLRTDCADVGSLRADCARMCSAESLRAGRAQVGSLRAKQSRERRTGATETSLCLATCA